MPDEVAGAARCAKDERSVGRSGSAEMRPGAGQYGRKSGNTTIERQRAEGDPRIAGRHGAVRGGAVGESGNDNDSIEHIEIPPPVEVAKSTGAPHNAVGTAPELAFQNHIECRRDHRVEDSFPTACHHQT